MILLREVQQRDVDALERLAQIPGFINLPSDRDALKDKIAYSQASFRGDYVERWESKFMFVAERIDESQPQNPGQVLGTSMVASRHGSKDSPHYYFEVGSEQKYSKTIQTGFIHGTLELKLDTDGPSEIGGLVVDRDARNTAEHIGRQISFVRFLFVALHRAWFKPKMIAELLPPLNKKGQSPLWEAVGRRFTNMDYWEADQLSAKNKEFILSLFPKGKIYTTFLPAEARNSIGKVSKDTEPVVHMLKKIGFEYVEHVDPFDGGPHLWASIDELVPIRQTKTFEWNLSGRTDQLGEMDHETNGLLAAVDQKPSTFRAVGVRVRRESGTPFFDIAQPELVHRILGLESGRKVAFMPFY